MLTKAVLIQFVVFVPTILILFFAGIQVAGGDLSRISGFDLSRVNDKARFASIAARLLFGLSGLVSVLAAMSFLLPKPREPWLLAMTVVILVYVLWHLFQMQKLVQKVGRL